MTNSMHHRGFSTLRDQDPFLGACPSWCVTKHTFEASHEDRDHFGEELHVSLELVKAEPAVLGSGEYLVSELDLYLQQNYREVAATVHLGINERAGWKLTLSETRELRDRLTALLDAHAGIATEPTTTPVPSQEHNNQGDHE